jgi:hypothetical protein
VTVAGVELLSDDLSSICLPGLPLPPKTLLLIMAAPKSFDSLPYDVFYLLIPYDDIEVVLALMQVNKTLHKKLWHVEYVKQVMKVCISTLR